jgi:predicted phage terminase large subunit-like protein
MSLTPEAKVQLTPELIEAFSRKYLMRQFDEAKPIPNFHRECWALYCSPSLNCGVAAPRGHAKSTSLTTVYMLAEMLFRVEEYAILVSSNEEMAVELLGDISRELTDNEDLINDFQIDKLLSQAKTDIIVRFKDGHQFRIIARGSGQKMRGRKWRGKRPGLIVCDDLEDDEQVENIDRRKKFRRWFNRALLPSMRVKGRVRIHGTILHEDALLARIMKNKEWDTRFYKAHTSFNDFSDILWPEQHDEKSLRAKRAKYIADGDPGGYSQEFLNDPFDSEETYLKKEHFLEMEDADHKAQKRFAVGVDFAVSRKDKANRTSLTVGGQDWSNKIHVVDERVGRWDTLEIIDEMFSVQAAWDPELFFVEDGVIWKSIEPMLYKEMQERGILLNVFPILSIKDKKVNGRSLQKRMKARMMRFDKQASWYEEYEAELLRFTGDSDAIADDQFDSTGILCRGFDGLALLSEEDFLEEEELYARGHGPARNSSRSPVTGY